MNHITDPQHYTTKTPEPIDVIEGWGLNYLEGNVVKYLSRWREKGGVTDLMKARWYLERLIANESVSKVKITSSTF